jgi:hypothetical protein
VFLALERQGGFPLSTYPSSLPISCVFTPPPNTHTPQTDILNNCKDNLAVLEGRESTITGTGRPVGRSFVTPVGPTATAEEIAVSSGPLQPVRHSTCAACGKASTALLPCSGCRSVSYCNRTCQLEAWKAHKTECRKTLREGDHALLKALQSKPELNGQRVVLHRLDVVTGRWEVGIVGSDGTEIKVLPKNLSRVQDSTRETSQSAGTARSGASSSASSSTTTTTTGTTTTGTSSSSGAGSAASSRASDVSPQAGVTFVTQAMAMAALTGETVQQAEARINRGRADPF